MNRKELFILAIITFATVMAWIGFGVYHARQATPITEAQKQEIRPLTPQFDNDIINALEKREE